MAPPARAGVFTHAQHLFNKISKLGFWTFTTMGVLTRRKRAELQKETVSSVKEAPPVVVEDADSSSQGSQDDDGTGSEKEPEQALANRNRSKSLRDRSRIPNSAYVCMALLISLQFFAGIYNVNVAFSWFHSMETSALTTWEKTRYLKELVMTLIDGNYRPWKEYAIALLSSSTIFSILYVFFVAPFRAGFWTGHRSRKQLLHRYMGLFYLVQYSFAWVEILTNFKDGAATSYIPHLIAMNGKSSFVNC